MGHSYVSARRGVSDAGCMRTRAGAGWVDPIGIGGHIRLLFVKELEFNPVEPGVSKLCLWALKRTGKVLHPTDILHPTDLMRHFWGSANFHRAGIQNRAAKLGGIGPHGCSFCRSSDSGAKGKSRLFRYYMVGEPLHNFVYLVPKGGL